MPEAVTPDEPDTPESVLAEFDRTHGPVFVGALRYFEYSHLPEGPLRDISRVVATLALRVHFTLPQNPETSAGFRKLLEAKDCFVRSALDIPTTPDDDIDALDDTTGDTTENTDTGTEND